MRSMDQFAFILKAAIEEQGINVRLLHPKPFFGKIIKGATGIGKWLGYIDKFFLFPWVLKKLVKQHFGQRVVYHICDQSNAFYVNYLPKEQTLVTCHDLMAIQASLGHYPGIRTGWSGKCLQGIILRGLRMTRHFTCVSKKTYDDLREITSSSNRDIIIIANALAKPFSLLIPAKKAWPSPHAQPLEDTLGNTPFLLHVGNDNWYKNRTGLIQVFASILENGSTELKLVLVGPPPSEQQLQGISEKVYRNIHSFQNLDHDTLNLLYNKCEALLFPSVMEGFGWPILEALSCGSAVILCNLAPMNEIAGNTACYLEDPHHFSSKELWVKDSTQKLMHYLADPTLHNQQKKKDRMGRSQEFQPDSIFPRYLSVYQSIVHDLEEKQQ